MNQLEPVLLLDWMTNEQCGMNSKLTCDAQDAVYHSHAFYEIFYMLEGEITHVINGTKEILRTGDAVFLSPRDKHLFIRAEQQVNAKHRDVVINPKLLDACSAFLGRDFVNNLINNATPPPPHAHLSAAQIHHFESRMNALGLLFSPLADQKRESIVRTTLIELLGVFYDAKTKSDTSVPQWMNNLLFRFSVVDYMREGLDKILEETYLSKSHCCRMFKKQFGMTMEQFLAQNRMNVAANLLQFTDNKILDICNTVGISSIAHFNKQFKAQFRVTPKAFRRAVRTSVPD